MLSDSIQDSKSYILDDFQSLIEDCGGDEIYVILQSAEAIKKSIRTRKLQRVEQT
ncbi:MAG: hypothetical protein FWB80_11725 [Defluviitaleaceae bacterium]|nr:hypothetical protein [Defluviitaleaceae bacterium]